MRYWLFSLFSFILSKEPFANYTRFLEFESLIIFWLFRILGSENLDNAKLLDKILDLSLSEFGVNYCY